MIKIQTNYLKNNLKLLQTTPNYSRPPKQNIPQDSLTLPADCLLFFVH